MVKSCPDLIAKRKVKDVVVGEGEYFKPVFYPCIKEKCIAYNNGKCRKYHAEVEEVEE